MKTRSLICRILCAALLLFTAAEATADKKNKNSEATVTDIHSLTKAENIATPAVPEKQHKPIADYMLREAQNILKQGYKVETERQGEVVVVTIPASDLFVPNSTRLEVSGQKLIEPFSAYLKTPNRFKVILAMHSDDTGSRSYLEQLTTARMQAVKTFLEKRSANPGQIAAYAVADDEPVCANSNIANRARNRRLEIYIIPDEELINQVKKR